MGIVDLSSQQARPTWLKAFNMLLPELRAGTPIPNFKPPTMLL